MRFDSIVLGAGMVGVSTALHLLKRGRSVALVDRRNPVEETSYGNAGIIQTEAVMAYTFPRDLGKIITYAFNRHPESYLRYDALPDFAPWLYQYWRHGAQEEALRSAHGLQPLISRSLEEHQSLVREAGADALLHHGGYLKLHRKPEDIEAAAKEQAHVRDLFGIPFEVLDAQGIQALEPHLTGMLGGIHLTGPVSVTDPADLGKAYVELFRKLGGEVLVADARTLETDGAGWQVQGADGLISGREAVIALGIWSRDVMAKLGAPVLLRAKRGYHMHYSSKGNATLSRPVLDADAGYVLAPMHQGIRLTTGVEFARTNAPPSTRQIDLAEPVARQLYPLNERIEDTPWLGRRPCFPDMLPAIGHIPGHPGLWANFGHQHLGFTLGPVTGRLLAEALTGEAPFTDMAPYNANRF